MRRTLLTLLALSRSVHLLAQLHTAATMLRFNTDKENVKIANKSIEFVKIIRENLRRNNDDYSLQLRQKMLTSRPKSTTTSMQPRRTTPTRPATRLLNRNRIMPSIRPPAPLKQTIHLPPKRRVLREHFGNIARQLPLNSLSPARAASYRGSLPGQLLKMSINARRNLNTTQNVTSGASVVPNATQFRSYTRSKHYKKVHVDKLKRLVDKEKDKMREKGRTGKDDTPEAMSPETIESTMETPRQQQANETQATPSPAPTLLTTTRETASEPNNMEIQQKELALRQLAESQSPAPDQLDMAPARGQQIQIIRFKGRMCQRNLMNIEGPVYDKQGKVMVPSHDPKLFRREFHQTRVPTVILPRCCNCCKKSVLGCQ